MEGGEPWAALEKDPLKLTVDDVYEISYDVGCQFRDVTCSQSSRAISELRFKILRVLEMFETLVSKSSISLEELRLERDNLKTEAERLMGELQNGASDAEQERLWRCPNCGILPILMGYRVKCICPFKGLPGRLQKSRAGSVLGILNQPTVGPDKFLINLQDPNCPRFTFQELSDVLQERNHLKARLLTTQALIQGYKSGIPTREEHHVVELEDGPCPSDRSG